ncbi:MAG: SCO family protein [Alcaligenaceae bacterium]|nr:SCO family protein [Alcaligenaceae bacterium]
MACVQRIQKASLSLVKLFFLSILLIFSFSSLTAKAETINFELFDPNGPVTQESYPGKFLLLAIGYTSCPDICPTTLYEYGYTMKHLKHADMLQPIFITIDPVNDEVNRLNAYTQYFDDRIIGLSGEMDNIETLAQQLGATFGYRLDGQRISNPEPGMGYTVYHSAMIYLINPERELVDVFDYQIGGDDLVESVDAHLEAALKKS